MRGASASPPEVDDGPGCLDGAAPEALLGAPVEGPLSRLAPLVLWQEETRVEWRRDGRLNLHYNRAQTPDGQ